MRHLHHTKLCSEAAGTANLRSNLSIFHGLLGSGRNWVTLQRKFLQQLDPHCRSVTAVDMRNHGRSFHSRSHSCGDLADDIDRYVLKELVHTQQSTTPGSHAVLMGHSMGGAAAMYAVYRHANGHRSIDEDTYGIHTPPLYATEDDADAPACVQALVVVDIAPSMIVPQEIFQLKRDMDILAKYDLSNIRSHQEADALLKRDIPSRMLRQFYLTNLVIPRDGSPPVWQCNLDVLRAEAKKIFFPLSPVDVEEKGYKKCNIRILFVFGSVSQYNTREQLELIPHFFTNTKIVVIPGAGHLVHYEKMDEFVKATKNFILDNF